MARLNNDFTFTGRIGRLTAYKMRGVKQIVVRSIGGPTAEQIKKLPQFKPTRAINTEWQQSNRKSPAAFLELASLHFEAIGDHTSIIIAGGIEFGMPLADGSIEFVPRSGSGKILVVG